MTQSPLNSPAMHRTRQHHVQHEVEPSGPSPGFNTPAPDTGTSAHCRHNLRHGHRTQHTAPGGKAKPLRPRTSSLLNTLVICAFVIGGWQVTWTVRHGLPVKHDSSYYGEQDEAPAATEQDQTLSVVPPPPNEAETPGSNLALLAHQSQTGYGRQSGHPAVTFTVKANSVPGYPVLPIVHQTGSQLLQQELPKNLSNLLEWDTNEAALELLRNYTNMHRAMIQDKTMHPRVLVVHFHTDTGMSNRMGVLVSALALAIATDRALLMDWPPVVAHWHPAREYIALPSVEQLLEPPVGVKWRWSESRNWLPPSGGCNGKHATASNCLDLQNPLSLHFGALLCGELDTATPDPRFKVPASGDVLHLQSWDFFLPLIKNNPTISPRLAPLGPEPASTLARWLLRPVPPLEDQAQGAFMHDLAGHFVVGIHIRMQGYNGVSAKQVKELAVCASRLVAGKLNGTKPALFFLASDSQQGITIVSKFAQAKNIKLVHMDSPLDSSSWRGSVAGTQAALVELRILAMCDELVISPGSTFGRAAHMWSSKHAHVLVNNPGSKGAVCMEKRVTEACCHSWKNAIIEPEPTAAKARSAFREPKLPKDAYACLKGPDMAYLERNHADCTVT